MAQISYWKQVNRLHDIYEYRRETDVALAEEREVLIASIKEYITDYSPGYDLVHIYQWVYSLKNKNNITLEEALILIGQEIYNRE
jgi:hypothetical protein